MSDVVVKARENGPFLITGPITLTDHLGNTWDLTGKANVALCRCGQSSKKPFCDGTHRTCGFVAGELGPVAGSAPTQPAPTLLSPTLPPPSPPAAT